MVNNNCFFFICHSDDRREEDVLLRTPSEKSLKHIVGVFEILRYTLFRSE